MDLLVSGFIVAVLFGSMYFYINEYWWNRHSADLGIVPNNKNLTQGIFYHSSIQKFRMAKPQSTNRHSYHVLDAVIWS